MVIHCYVCTIRANKRLRCLVTTRRLQFLRLHCKFVAAVSTPWLLYSTGDAQCDAINERRIVAYCRIHVHVLTHRQEHYNSLIINELLMKWNVC